MKRILKLLRMFSCFALITLLLAAQLPAKAAVAGSSTMAKVGAKYVVTASYLNFRSGPGVGYSVLTGLKRGTTVTYMGYKNSWWQVRTSGGKTGYVDRKYLTPASVSKTGQYFVTASKLRVRKSPTTSSSILGTVNKGAMITITQLNGDWGYVSSGAGVRGWVALQYLSTSGSSSGSSSGSHIVIADVLNVRAGASTSKKRIDSLKNGAAVKVVETDGSWGKITYLKSGKTREGWVKLDYLRAK